MLILIMSLIWILKTCIKLEFVVQHLFGLYLLKVEGADIAEKVANYS